MSEDSGGVRPVSPREMYQYAAAAFRRNLFAPTTRIEAAFRATGRAFDLTMFRNMAAFARANEERAATKAFNTSGQALPNSYYRETRAFGGAEFRITALVEVQPAGGAPQQEIGFTLASRRSLSPAEWLAQANEALERYKQRYQYAIIGTNLVDPRRNPAQAA